MKIVLDDRESTSLYPFTATRSVADIRVGILTIREKWELIMGEKVWTLSDPASLWPENYLLVPAHVLPPESIRTAIENNTFDPSNSEYKKLKYPWHIFQYNGSEIRHDFLLITQHRSSRSIPTGNHCIEPGNIFIEEGARISYSSLNASEGPIYIGKDSEIMEGCLIRGPFALGNGSVVKMGTKIYGATTIGPGCTVGGEIKNSVFFGYSNKAHDGYLGDSVIGEWCNLGAGTSSSNLKNTAGLVKVGGGIFEEAGEGLAKCGLLMGDYSRAAINTSFNTGTIAGVCCNIFDYTFPPGYIPDFSWGSQRYDLEKAFVDINNWKRLKLQSITEKEKSTLTNLYHKLKLRNA